MGGSNDNFGKTICSTCYEELNPTLEDLQSISICGHVFHNPCLKRWFEYCAKSKKQTCPVCKQGCTDKDVGRLYFNSVGDPVQSQNPVGISEHGDCPEVLQREVKRLENKVSGFVFSLDQRNKNVQHLTTQLRICETQLSKEVTVKTAALREKECIQLMLQTKTRDLDKSTAHYSRLQNMNLKLAKEIDDLKSVSNCNLDDEEIVKFASLGNISNSRDAIDVLKKSLATSNKSYKELMDKCNTLGKGEARSLENLEKAKENIVKLRIRILELETTIEAKDNEALGCLKDLKKRRSTDITSSVVDKTTNCATPFKQTLSEEKGQCPPFVINLDEDIGHNSLKVKETSRNFLCVNKLKTGNEDEQQKLASTSKFDTTEMRIQRDLAGCVNHVANVKPSLKDVFLGRVVGDQCFSGGLLGPDGGNTYLGKWFKRASNNANDASGLISVGADGRGGRVKVLKPTSEARDTVVLSKKLKTGPKASSHLAQGCLQIEHFFSKAPN